MLSFLLWSWTLQHFHQIHVLPQLPDVGMFSFWHGCWKVKTQILPWTSNKRTILVIHHVHPLSAKPSCQLWYPGGQRLKTISFSWSGVKSPSKCFSNTGPTAIIASRDEKRCNAPVQWTRSVHSSSLRLSDQHRKCPGWLLFFAFLRCILTVLQLYIHVHDDSEVRNGSEIGSRKQVPQNSLVCGWWRVETSFNHTLISPLFFLFWRSMDHRTRLVPIATTIDGTFALDLANTRKSSFHSSFRRTITKVLCSAWGSP